jgi:hypothetical protein
MVFGFLTIYLEFFASCNPRTGEHFVKPLRIK